MKRTNATRVPVAVDKPLIASEQEIADTFTEPEAHPAARSTSRDFVDTRFNGDLPPSTTAPRVYGKDSSMNVHLHWFLPTGGDGRTLVDRHAYTDGGSSGTGSPR